VTTGSSNINLAGLVNGLTLCWEEWLSRNYLSRNGKFCVLCLSFISLYYWAIKTISIWKG